MIQLSDAVLRIAIGVLGLIFVVWHMANKQIRRRLEQAHVPGKLACGGYGMVAGITSSLAHAAGPVMQMALLPQKLPKQQFAATMIGYFLCLNLIKMAPFLLLGRIQSQNLTLGLLLLPVIPLGVFAGYALTRVIRQRQYEALIFCALTVTSFFLILNGLRSD